MMMISEHIRAEALSALDDQRYGDFTNPFILGLLTALEIVEREYPTPMPTHEVTFSFRNPEKADPRAIAKLETIARLLCDTSDGNNVVIDTSGMRWSSEDEDLQGQYAAFYEETLQEEGMFDPTTTRLSTLIADITPPDRLA